jgi:insulysin
MSFIRKSKIDQRIYKSLVLPNKISCLLISDAETEKSAAALNVNVGSLEDPVDVSNSFS